MLSPLPRRSVWAYCFAHFAQPCQPSPIWRSGRPAHRPFRGLLGVHSRYGLHTRAVTVYRDSLIRRLQPLRFLHSCSGCFRLERLPGGACTHWKAPPFHGARHEQTCKYDTCVANNSSPVPYGNRRGDNQRQADSQPRRMGAARLCVWAGLFDIRRNQGRRNRQWDAGG